MDERTRDVDNSVCIIIAAYNASATIERAIRSALAEPEVSEILVIDDASTDRTAEIVHQISILEQRVKLIRLVTNGGPSRARNYGLEAATSEWIGILDADDYFVNGRTAKLLAAAQEVDFVADDLWQVMQGEVLSFDKTLSGGGIRQPFILSLADFVAGNLSSAKRLRGELGFLKPLMRKQFLRQRDLIYQSHMRLGEDYELYARALANGARFLVLPPQGYVSVCRSNSLSGAHTEDDLKNLRDCDESLLQIPTLDKSERRLLMQHYESTDRKYQWRVVIQAFKTRNYVAVLKAYNRSWGVKAYLSLRLAEQLWQRTIGRFVYSGD